MAGFAPPRGGQPIRSVITVADLLGRPPRPGGARLGGTPGGRTAVSVAALMRREHAMADGGSRPVIPEPALPGAPSARRGLANSAGALLAVGSMAGMAALLGHHPLGPGGGGLEGGPPNGVPGTPTVAAPGISRMPPGDGPPFALSPTVFPASDGQRVPVGPGVGAEAGSLPLGVSGGLVPATVGPGTGTPAPAPDGGLIPAQRAPSGEPVGGGAVPVIGPVARGLGGAVADTSHELVGAGDRVAGGLVGGLLGGSGDSPNGHRGSAGRSAADSTGGSGNLSGSTGRGDRSPAGPAMSTLTDPISAVSSPLGGSGSSPGSSGEHAANPHSSGQRASGGHDSNGDSSARLGPRDVGSGRARPEHGSDSHDSHPGWTRG